MNKLLQAFLQSTTARDDGGKVRKFLSRQRIDEILEIGAVDTSGKKPEAVRKRRNANNVKRRERLGALQEIYGITFEYDRSEDGYWLLDVGNVVFNVGAVFSDDDLVRVAVGDHLARTFFPHLASGGDDFLGAFGKLMPERITGRVRGLVSQVGVVFPVARADGPMKDMMSLISEAIGEKRRISFAYRRPRPVAHPEEGGGHDGGTPEEITGFSPCRIYFAWRSSRVLGRREGAAEFESFNLNHMENVTKEEAVALDFAPGEIERCLQSALLFLPGAVPGKGTKVVLEIGPPMAESVKRTQWPQGVSVRSQKGREGEDMVILSFYLANPYEALPLVFENAPWARVLEPDSLRDCANLLVAELLLRGLDPEMAIDWSRTYFDMTDMKIKDLAGQEPQEELTRER